MARLTHQCPGCKRVVIWPEFTPLLKGLSLQTGALLRATGTLVPWISQCPHCKGTFSRVTILTGGKYDQDT